MNRYILPIAGFIVVAGGLGAWFLLGTDSSAMTFRTEKATRGELLATVSATGTVEPEDVVDVGAQVAGSIKAFGTGDDGKSIDYGSPVEPDMVLAHIDDSLYKAKADQSRALLRSAERRFEQAKAKVEQAKANTLRAQADLKQAQAKANQSTREWERVRALDRTGAISQTDFDVARANDETNRAGVAVAEAAITQAKAAEADAEAAVGDAEAAVATAKAILQQDEINLGYCTIKSPVKGTIIDRRVTLGQTVQAAFNTPSLFLIAKDLSRMTVWASVNEADISRIRIGQTARFTVDAHPNHTFTGTVTRVRLNATNTQNVVVYTVEVTTDNSEGQLLPKLTGKSRPSPEASKAGPADAPSRSASRGAVSGTLLPYMTANLQFEVDRRADALLVPNAALRYRPSAQAMGGRSNRGDAGGEREKPGQGVVWVEENGKAKSVTLQLGLTDGNMTEVLSGDLQPGTPLIVSELRSGAPPADASNPFSPKMGGGKKQ